MLMVLHVRHPNMQVLQVMAIFRQEAVQLQQVEWCVSANQDDNAQM